jgi:hypothetical protein
MPSTPLPKVLQRNIQNRTTSVLWFNVYRQLFTFCLTLNGISLVLAALDKFPYVRNHLGALVLGNSFTVIQMRNELFFRFRLLYLISFERGEPPQCNSCEMLFHFLQSPLWLRLCITSVLQHVRGTHCGCAISGSACASAS